MHGADPAGDRRRVVEHTNAQGDVDRPTHKILPVITEDEFDTQTGMLISETRQTRQDATYCET